MGGHNVRASIEIVRLGLDRRETWSTHIENDSSLTRFCALGCRRAEARLGRRQRTITKRLASQCLGLKIYVQNVIAAASGMGPLIY